MMRFMALVALKCYDCNRLVSCSNPKPLALKHSWDCQPLRPFECKASKFIRRILNSQLRRGFGGLTIEVYGG